MTKSSHCNALLFIVTLSFMFGCHQPELSTEYEDKQPMVLAEVNRICGREISEYVSVFRDKFKFMKNTEHFYIKYVSSYSIYFILIPSKMGGFDSVFPYEHNPKDCAANKPNENDQLLHNVRLFNTLIINYFFDPNSIDLEDYFDDLMFFITQRGMPFKSGYPVHYTKKHPQIITRFRSKPYEIKKVGEKYFAAVITINFQGDARIWDFVILPNGTIDDFKFTTYKEVFLN